MYRRIDLLTGMFLEDVILPEGSEITQDLISLECCEGFYIPKWTGTEWVEGASQEYIDGLNGTPPKPTTDEKLEELADNLTIAMETIMILSLEG